jgi:hypothetical protein
MIVNGSAQGRCEAPVTDRDRYRVEVYAHYWRHDVEKRRRAPLTR